MGIIYGVTTSGFVKKTEQVLFDEMAAEARSTISPSLDMSNNSVIGRLIAIVAASRAQDWEVIEATYNSQWETASDASLDNVSALTGTTRKSPTKSTVTASVNMDNTTAVTAGQIIASVAGNPDALFENVADFTAPSTGDHDLAFIAQSTGAVQAPSGTLTVLEVTISGVNSITNADDADPGTDLEQDTPLRVRRREELTAAGTGTDDAMRADILRVDDVEDVNYLVNRTQVLVDVNGLAPHTFEAVVFGGTDAAIAAAIWAGQPSGIGSAGTTSQTTPDTQGNTQTVRFSRPTDKRTFLGIDVTVDPLLFPATGDADIAVAVAKFTDGSLLIDLGDGNFLNGELGVGDDLILTALYPAIFTISGVLDITEIRADFSAAPVPTVNLPIGAREIVAKATANGVDSGDIVVVST